MKTAKIFTLLIIVQLFGLTPVMHAAGKAVDTVPPRARCSVCGMFVEKYPNWVAQIHYGDEDQVKFFDGVKDMLVFYFDPEKFGGPSQETFKDLYVRDYYTLDWLSAKEVFFVVGSDVYGPMGHELIPFHNREAADSFLKDHHGTAIVTFGDITPQLIESLRVGQKMR